MIWLFYMFSGSFTYLSGVLQACALIVCAFCILQNEAFIHTGETLDILTAADFTYSSDVGLCADCTYIHPLFWYSTSYWFYWFHTFIRCCGYSANSSYYSSAVLVSYKLLIYIFIKCSGYSTGPLYSMFISRSGILSPANFTHSLYVRAIRQILRIIHERFWYFTSSGGQSYSDKVTPLRN